jgi:hypothetical protein
MVSNAELVRRYAYLLLDAYRGAKLEQSNGSSWLFCHDYLTFEKTPSGRSVYTIAPKGKQWAEESGLLAGGEAGK